ncbi:MAG: FkbM family methyltransferase [Sediminicola sp.]|jgi:FkbM family methyltransferase
MGIFEFVYRQKQRIKYHIAPNDISRLLAEINRNIKLIELNGNNFRLKGFEFQFPKQYLFLLNRYDDLLFILKQNNKSFTLINNKLVFEFDDLRMNITTAEELYIIKEVFYHKIYNINFGKSFSVIDVGMNVGFTSLYFANRIDVNQVFGFEPFKLTFIDAEENFRLNSKAQEKIVRRNVGLGLKNEIIAVEYSSELKGKNISKADRNSGNGGKELTSINLLNAKKEIEKIVSRDISKNFVIKLDCEGAEFDIFNTFSSKSIPQNVIAFMIEWHNQYPTPIIEKLISNNFKLHCTSNKNEIGYIIALR